MTKSLEELEREYWEELVSIINRNNEGSDIRNSQAISVAYGNWDRTHRVYIESLEDFS